MRTVRVCVLMIQDGWTRVDIAGDHHCMFRACLRVGRGERLSKDISNEQEMEQISELRGRVASVVTAQWDTWSHAITIRDPERDHEPQGRRRRPPRTAGEYLQRMSTDEWGGQVELQILSTLLGVNFHIIDRETKAYTVVQPTPGMIPDVSVGLSGYGTMSGVMFYSGDHYDLMARPLPLAEDKAESAGMEQIATGKPIRKEKAKAKYVVRFTEASLNEWLMKQVLSNDEVSGIARTHSDESERLNQSDSAGPHVRVS